MTEIVRQLFEGSKQNDEFLLDAYNADGDRPPKLWSPNVDKIGFAMIYYGWLVGKYGVNWRSNI